MSEPIRVLQVFHSMDCGGAENMIMNIYRNIDRSLVQFDFMVHSNDKAFFDDEIKALGGRIHYVPYYNVINEGKYRLAVREVLNCNTDISVVHGHLGSCAHVYLDVAKKEGCYTIAHSHNTRPAISIKSILYRYFTYKTRKTADFFMSCGKEAGRYRFGEEIINDNKRYRIINNAIDTSKYVFDKIVRMQVRKELGLEDKFIIGHIGRFSDQKNHGFLIEVFNEYAKTNSEAELILVGEGKTKESIQEKVNNLNLQSKVHFLGLRNDVFCLLQGFDCMLFPSKYEGLPVTLIEAQASGLPCVISNTITDDVKVTDLVSSVSLDSDYSKWIKAINGSAMIERSDRSKDIINNGYDIKNTVGWLEDFYTIHPSRRNLVND